MKQHSLDLQDLIFSFAKEREVTPYAIIDSAVDGMIDGHFESDEPFKEILYSDQDDRISLESSAPHLILLERDDLFTLRIFNEGIGECWGCFVFSSDNFEVLANHLKQYTKIYSQEHQQYVYIRFYDPRAIEKYFSILDKDEAKEFFSKIDSIICENPKDNKSINIYNFDNESSQITYVRKILDKELGG